MSPTENNKIYKSTAEVYNIDYGTLDWYPLYVTTTSDFKVEYLNDGYTQTVYPKNDDSTVYIHADTVPFTLESTGTTITGNYGGLKFIQPVKISFNVQPVKVSFNDIDWGDDIEPVMPAKEVARPDTVLDYD